MIKAECMHIDDIVKKIIDILQIAYGYGTIVQAEDNTNIPDYSNFWSKGQILSPKNYILVTWLILPQNIYNNKMQVYFN